MQCKTYTQVTLKVTTCKCKVSDRKLIYFFLLNFTLALCMLIGCLLFPAGWDSLLIKEVCGPDADSYAPGQCGIRWAYILAMIGVIDCAVLSILAFVLGTRYVKLLPDQYLPNGSITSRKTNYYKY